GTVTVANGQLDDMVLLRADGTPTYMLSVVVDDHDMGVTHAIRGDDHLTNAFRQTQLYRLLGWEPPVFAHIPLIHGPDGAKLSKRHGALGVEAYRELGYLPEALRNYLLRLGWGHGDDEIIPTAQAIDWFDLDGVGRSPARFDLQKLDHLNGHYLREADDERLADLVASRFQAVSETGRHRLVAGMQGLKARVKTVAELSEMAEFYLRDRPLALNDKAAKLLAGDAPAILSKLHAELQSCNDWTAEALESLVRQFAEAQGVKLGAAAQPLRAALTGSNVSPPVFEVMQVLGRQESLDRIADRAA
ncbi:glutamate--tRNA ligase, partial [Algihabitans albus]